MGGSGVKCSDTELKGRDDSWIRGVCETLDLMEGTCGREIHRTLSPVVSVPVPKISWYIEFPDGNRELVSHF